MKLFYLDESGNPEPTGSSKSYILTAVGVPIEEWARFDREVNQLKISHFLAEQEIHTAWIMRKYPEQDEIESFEQMSHAERREAVRRKREILVAETIKKRNKSANKNIKHIFDSTDAYIHLTYAERKRFIYALADKIRSWTKVRLFAEIIDKSNYAPPRPEMTPLSQAFERVITRIEKYLSHISKDRNKEYGMLIHDECEAAAASHKKNMRRYYIQGTFRSKITHIIETPLFVSSEQTNMIQIADLCAYAIRRFFDYGERDIYDLIKFRADMLHDANVGFNHYTTDKQCSCELCSNRRKRRK